MKEAKGVIILLLILAILAALVTSLCLYIGSYEYSSGIFINYYRECKIFLINFAIIYLIMLILTFLIRSAALGYFLTSAIFLAAAYGSYLKVLYRSEPLYFSDFSLFQEATTMMGKYSLRFEENLYIMIALGALILLPTIGLLFIKFSYTGKAITALIMTFAFVVFVKTLVYDDNLYYTLGKESGLNEFIEMDSYMSKGFAYPLFYSLKNVGGYKYDKFDKQEARETIKAYSSYDIPADKKVNIMMVMLESFKDFSIYKNEKLEFTKDPYKNFHELMQEGIVGHLIVNSFGGGTFLTESNVLTGYKNLPEFKNPAPTYVSYFKDNGYTTHAFHPYVGTFYNRVNKYPKMGFQDFKNMDNYFKNIKDEILSDQEFFPIILEDYKNTLSEGKPIFSMSVTYQNHGPYYSDGLYGEDSLVVKKDNYPEKWYNYFSNYMSGIAWTDQSLKILKDELEKSEAPTMLVLYGDHSPSAGPDKIMFDMLGINKDLASDDGYENIMSTTYVIWANPALRKMYGKPFQEAGQDLEPAFLMPKIFEELGYKGNEYNQFLTDFSKKCTVLKDQKAKIDGRWISKTKNADENEDQKLLEKISHEYFNTEYYMEKFYLKDKASKD
ncbi:LTA synthase family protein [Peptoniphilus sp. GNH]|nr:LTA synthase family protein [Peptoniphilus sp. GNH]